MDLLSDLQEHEPPPITAPLSELQYAYLLGEIGDFQLGGPALFYEEYACHGLDLQAFSNALYQLMQRHEMLRATFDEAGLLHIQDNLPVPLTYRILRGLPEATCRRVITDGRDRICRSGPPLGRRAPFDVAVYALDNHFVVQVCGRLLAMDGFSGEIFAQELRALLDGETLPPLRYSFPQYRRDFERRKDEESYAVARKYWMDRLETLPAAPELPRRRLSGNPDPRLVRRVFRMPANEWSGLAERIKKNRMTGTMVLGTAFCEVLRHWSKNPDFTINMMYGERSPFHPDADKIIGNFSSTVLVECAAGAAESTFVARAKAWRRQLLRDLEHSAFSGVSVIRELNQLHGNSRHASMPVVFTSMLGVGDAGEGVFLEHLGWQRLEGRVRTPQVALDHQVYVADNALVTTWDSADDLYPAGMIDEMFAAYRMLLTRLATDDDAWQETVFDLTPARQLTIRRTVNDTAAPVPMVTLHDLFRKQAERNPERTAVIAGGDEISYGRLQDQANAIAADLIAEGVRPGDLVGVRAVRGPRQTAALLGVLMAGAAYVPISPEWPRHRREQVADVAGLRLLLSDRTNEAEPEADGVHVVDIATAMARHDGADRVTVPVPSRALAYVIFTSGTTGTPKGVMIAHDSAANTIVDVNERFGVGTRDRVLAVSDFTFDLSVWDTFGTFAAGGTLVIPDAGHEREVTHLYDLCQTYGVTVWNSVPAYLLMFTDFVRAGDRPPLPELRLAMVSGDWVPVHLGSEVSAIAPNVACVSLGGATEASIWSNYFPVPVEVPEHWVSIPYGYPLRNQRFQVLDGRMSDRPDWVPGELFIAGHGLAEGYLGDAELTAATFLTHPRSAERIYRSGDWARYWPDGTLEFLGREDPQVKVNGFRVELGEVEAALLSHPRVTDAAVVARNDGRGVTLVAFVAATAAAEHLVAQLKEHLGATLPAYMTPHVIEVLDRLPLTGNGKVDRRRLGERARSATVAPVAVDATPRTPTEQVLAQLWSELLGLTSVAYTDDFFARGGSSLQAAQLMNRIEQRLGRRLPLATLYTSGTLERLAAQLDETGVTAAESALVRLAEQDGPPIVLVHPVGGDLLCYRPLVDRLRARYRVYGLTSAGARRHRAVEEMAAGYLAELTPVLDDGPVRLAGWSFGGTVAYEMGRRLRRDGRDCRVVLLDPWLRDPANPTPDGVTLVRAFLHNLAGTAVQVPELPADTTEALRRTWSAPPPELSVLRSIGFAELQDMFSAFEANTRALLRYTVTPEDGMPVTVVEASCTTLGPAGGYLVPWRQAAPTLPGARFHTLDGDHFAMVAGENADTVAQLVDD
ncbi:amino acid adenylation domain-containing protein [Micromonospora sp. R77]|uniref:non-ribosomal peptide synthetase n=1 Tax=Micromonospora sp. R77 TaxID=2925836 RepID=UPI001F622A5B|nr:amino acid adenylation domain-containing protein [Micromonospora sp. R77]MCI4066448.1 amino acid adenylation domain-containing protein [Micromonospora sp. R77]